LIRIKKRKEQEEADLKLALQLMNQEEAKPVQKPPANVKSEDERLAQEIQKKVIILISSSHHFFLG
jgi:hypothetical protein